MKEQIHNILLQLLKDKHYKPERFASDSDFLRYIFKNYRPSGKSSLMLSKYGLNLMNKCFNGYTFDIEKNKTISNHDIIFLNRYITVPWYIDEISFTVFDDDIAADIKIMGSIHTFIDFYKK